MPLISIVVPVHNTSKYLSQCLTSIASQTFKDCEVIVIDDASTDNSRNILKKFELTFDNFQCIYLDKNIRQGGARNIGLDRVRGKYIGFVDSDDFIDKNMYLRLYKKALSSDADVTFCSYNKYYSDDRIEKIPPPGRRLWTSLFKQEVWEDLRFPENVVFEDNAIGWVLTKLTPKTASVPENLYYYRMHPESTTKERNTYRIDDRITTGFVHLEECKKRGYYEKYNDEVVSHFVNCTYINSVWYCFSHFDTPNTDYLYKLQNLIKTTYPDYYEYKGTKATPEHYRKLAWLNFMSPKLAVFAQHKLNNAIVNSMCRAVSLPTIGKLPPAISTQIRNEFQDSLAQTTPEIISLIKDIDEILEELGFDPSKV
ncbi:glycosyltransferase family 2 protein [Maridesulfovibrio sp.]|uniref:glycosyltransferase family 2 protein n=1 Tax=Maridesulfovibrio sp. TaxID=2795000 RepID=UPI002A18AF51|nr:glycosyltransferase family 2 protein [Maridesulfovibrio sp.]